MFRKLTISVVALLLLAGTMAVVWSGLNLAPFRFLWRYGLTPGCEPTGEVIHVQDIEFVVIGPGVCRIGSDYLTREPRDDSLGLPPRVPFERSDVVGRMGEPIGLAWGTAVSPSNEMPVHWIEFRRPFGIATKEVTNGQFEKFSPRRPESLPSRLGDRPWSCGTWEQARAFCEWLSERSGWKVRLPSEAEWECACRAGTSTEWECGGSADRLEEFAWYGRPYNSLQPSLSATHDVGTKKANRWGLFDMAGNVWEWCEDTWHDSYRLTRSPAGPRSEWGAVIESVAPTDGSAWVEAGAPERVCRNAGRQCPASWCRSASRSGSESSMQIQGIGFRPALTIPEDR